MNEIAGDTKRRHSLSDWLALHELDTASCRRVLDTMTCEATDEPAADMKPGLADQALNPETDWLRTAEAMREFLPEQHSNIDDTFENTVRTVAERLDRSRKALTLDNGAAAYPTILYTYYGEPADSLVIAHEFAHAVQIRASQGKFVVPVLREVCAFLGEGALLSHALRRDETQYASLAQAWGADNHKYLVRQRDQLKKDLMQPNTPYKYLWNYPIARYLAIQIAKHFSGDAIWDIFGGKSSVQDVLRKLAATAG